MALSRFSVAAAAALLLSASAAAQNSLCTIPILPGNSDNQGSANGSIFFDITVKNSVIITGFDCNFYYPNSVGSPVGLTVHTCASTYVGNELNPSVWTQVGVDDGTSTHAGIDMPTPITLKTPFTLNPGMYGMALVGDANTGHRYTGIGTGATYMTFANADMSLNLGAATNSPFGPSIYVPRVWNGCIKYGPGCYEKYGTGCPGSNACIPDLSLAGCAVAGQAVTIDVTNGLGGGSVFFLFGLGRGPLPMGGGCSLNFSTLLPVSFAVPSGGSGPCNGSVTVSGLLPLVTSGLTVNMQVFVPDPAGAIGFSNSNGLEFLIK